jgi:hypothetical protein
VRHQLILGFALTAAAVVASGCDASGDAPRAPGCDEQRGCPPWARCVDGMFCEVIEGAERGDDLPGVLRPVPTSGVDIGSGGRPRPPQPDLDAGFGELPPGFGDELGADGCIGGQVLCGNACVDLRLDPLNCGGCGFVCRGAARCQYGVCCEPQLLVCGNRCIDPLSDPQNCGGCGLLCPFGSECLAGTCQPPLSGGLPGGGIGGRSPLPGTGPTGPFAPPVGGPGLGTGVGSGIAPGAGAGIGAGTGTGGATGVGPGGAAGVGPGGAAGTGTAAPQ